MNLPDSLPGLTYLNFKTNYHKTIQDKIPVSLRRTQK